MTTLYKRRWTDPKGKVREAYRVQFIDDTGKQRSKQFSTLRAAKAFQVSPSAPGRAAVHGGVTIHQLCVAFQRDAAAGAHGGFPLEADTLKTYQGYVTNYIEPHIGDIQIKAFKPPAAKDFLDTVLESAISRVTARKVVNYLRQVFKYAVRRELVASDPTAGLVVKLSSRHRKQIIIPSKVEVAKLLETARNKTCVEDRRVAEAWQRYYPLLLVLVYTGMRLSEVRGLPRSEILVEEVAIRVRQRADRNGRIGPPKTRHGVRKIYVPALVIDECVKWLATHNHDLVFPAEGSGLPIGSQNLFKRMWTPLCNEAGLGGRYTLHSIRHFHASRLIASGKNVKEISHVLGHADEGFTLRVYGHLFTDKGSEDRRREEAQALVL